MAWYFPNGRTNFLGGFTPGDSATLNSWHDCADTGTITDAGGGDVSQIDDKSPNGYDLVQTVPTTRGVTGVRTLNGLNVIDWQSTNQRLENTSFGIASTIMFSGVFVIDSFNASSSSIFSINSTGDFQVNANGAANFQGILNATVCTNIVSPDGPWNDSQAHIWTLTFDFVANTAEMFVDGVSQGSVNDYNTSLSTVGIEYYINRNRNGSNGTEGALAEIITDTDLSLRPNYETYFSNRWAI